MCSVPKMFCHQVVPSRGCSVAWTFRTKMIRQKDVPYKNVPPERCSITNKKDSWPQFISEAPSLNESVLQTQTTSISGQPDYAFNWECRNISYGERQNTSDAECQNASIGECQNISVGRCPQISIGKYPHTYKVKLLAISSHQPLANCSRHKQLFFHKKHQDFLGRYFFC